MPGPVYPYRDRRSDAAPSYRRALIANVLGDPRTQALLFENYRRNEALIERLKAKGRLGETVEHGGGI